MSKRVLTKRRARRIGKMAMKLHYVPGRRVASGWAIIDLLNYPVMHPRRDIFHFVKHWLDTRDTRSPNIFRSGS